MDEFLRDFCVLCPLFLGIVPSCDHQEISETSGNFSPSTTWLKLKLEGRPTTFTLCLHTWHSLKELYIVIWLHLFIRRKRHAESQGAKKDSLCLTENKAENENFQFHGSVEASPGWVSGFCHDEPMNLLLSYLKWYSTSKWKTPASPSWGESQPADFSSVALFLEVKFSNHSYPRTNNHLWMKFFAF